MLSLIFIKIGFALLANSEASAHSLLQVILNRVAASQEQCSGFESRLGWVAASWPCSAVTHPAHAMAEDVHFGTRCS